MNKPILDFVRRMSAEESNDAVVRHQRHLRELAAEREKAVAESDFETAKLVAIFERMTSERLSLDLANLERTKQGGAVAPAPNLENDGADRLRSSQPAHSQQTPTNTEHGN